MSSQLRGLRRAGWDGKEALIRFAVLGNMAVRITCGLPESVYRCTQAGLFQIRDPQRLAERKDYYRAALDHLLTLGTVEDQRLSNRCARESFDAALRRDGRLVLIGWTGRPTLVRRRGMAPALRKGLRWLTHLNRLWRW